MNNRRHMNPKISIHDTAALQYVEEAAVSLREQMLALLRALPEEMEFSGKAVNAAIKDVFEEGDFTFAMYVEKDDKRPTRKFLGISALASFLPFDTIAYLANNTNVGLIEFLEKEYTVEKCTNDLLWCMQSLYESRTEF